MTNDCVTLWVGDALGPVERACMRSVLRQGHSLALYCYEEPAGVPQGVEVRDASAVVPKGELLAPWFARADLYSDRFRYELLRRSLGTWIDADVYFVGRLDLERPYLFGEEAPGVVNNAVLRLPADSPLLPRLLEPFDKRTTPRWLPWRYYLPLRLRELVVGQADLRHLPWGTTSPQALTALTKEYGLYHWAQPQERFYPMPWQEARWILDPERQLDEVIGDGTVTVHLWNECIKNFKGQPAPEGSFLAQLQREGA
ncbi:MAG: hypothetical protein M3438_05615 [Pseudomonadota bacterium]|nr:hypothetical protein [Pseudomonadota bacterium]